MQERTTFSESQFIDYSVFADFVKLKFPILYDSEIEKYHDVLKRYYTQSNPSPYNNWEERIYAWINRDMLNSSKFKMVLCRIDTSQDGQ